MLVPTVRSCAEFLCWLPKIVGGNKNALRLDILNCPLNTIQIIFLADDGSLISQSDTLQGDLCLAARPQTTAREVWIPAKNTLAG